MHWLFIVLLAALLIFVVISRTDNKELEELKEFLLKNSNRTAIIKRIAGYGGGSIIFNDSHNKQYFHFISDKYLFMADGLITNTPSSFIASRISM